MKTSLLAVLLLAACSLGDRPVTETYVLKAQANAVSSLSQSNSCTASLTLQIADPNAATGIDTTRIAVMEGQNQLNYYQNAAWSDSAPGMFSSILLDTFTQAKIFANVNSEQDSLPSDVTLITDIHDFEVDNRATGEVKLRLVAKLIDTKTRQILTTIALDKKQLPSADNMAAIISAFNQISIDTANEIIARVKTVLKNSQAWQNNVKDTNPILSLCHS